MSENKLIPLGPRVILERLETESKTPSGIYIPESAKETPLQARVVALGTCCSEDQKCSDTNKSPKTPPIKEGDIVIVPKWAGTEIKNNDKTFIVAKFDELLCVVTK